MNTRARWGQLRAAVDDALAKAGKPMHWREIAAAIGYERRLSQVSHHLSHNWDRYKRLGDGFWALRTAGSVTARARAMPPRERLTHAHLTAYLRDHVALRTMPVAPDDILTADSNVAAAYSREMETA